VAAEGGEGLWGLARTIKAGVSRALKEGHVFNIIKESTYYHTTARFTYERIVKVGRRYMSQSSDRGGHRCLLLICGTRTLAGVCPRTGTRWS
jgi:hypothetical protein